MVLKLADGHFDTNSWWPNSCREKDFFHQQLLGALGGKELSCLESNYEGRTWRDFIIEALPQKLKKKGAKSEKYRQEEKLFINLAKKRFLKSLNDSLRDNGDVVLVKDEISKQQAYL